MKTADTGRQRLPRTTLSYAPPRQLDRAWTETLGRRRVNEIARHNAAPSTPPLSTHTNCQHTHASPNVNVRHPWRSSGLPRCGEHLMFCLFPCWSRNPRGHDNLWSGQFSACTSSGGYEQPLSRCTCESRAKLLGMSGTGSGNFWLI